MPVGAYFVAPNGSDSAAGTQAAPWRTLAHAISAARSGSTIVLRAGNYNESVTVQATKSLTIQSFPSEAVWLDGSTPVDNWTRSGNTWVHNGWTAKFSSLASYTKTVPTAPGFAFVNPAYPMAAYPDQVWFGTEPLTQVATAAAVGPGTFYVDYQSDQLVVGDDPTGHEVTASNLGIAFTSYGPNVTLRGIGVRKYATAVGDMGTMRVDGAGDVVENVVSNDNATTGLFVGGTRISVRNVTTSRNGMLGMTAGYADYLSVDGLLASDNNTQHFNSAPVSGGLKIARSRNITVRNSSFIKNLGVGVWFDESCYNLVLVGSTVTGNSTNGAVAEVSSTGVIANNTITGSGAIGLKINNTDGLQIWNNTIIGNRSQVQIVEDNRRGTNPANAGHDPRQPQPDPTEPWVIRNDAFMNNVVGPSSSGMPQLIVRDYSGQYAADQLNVVISGNAFVGAAAGGLVTWGTGGSGATTYPTVPAFQAGTGQRGNAGPPTLAAVDSSLGMPLPPSVAAIAQLAAGLTRVGAV
ncbi:right-handed parallel beta-helix repeat-containing protein [uncultured Jatrophihabitans sp.]|uniref:right-handed parallel beta-helix repeat-containing protein n=1 Tax=uncultured Jatrophihabitans sp. TaxID=1610747 RepID=UPI0035CB390C